MRNLSAKFCAFGLKINGNWNLLRKFWNLHIKISMENWLFIHFLSNLPGPLSFYTALEKHHFLQQFFGFRGSSPPPLPAGAPDIFEKCFNLQFSIFLALPDKCRAFSEEMNYPLEFCQKFLQISKMIEINCLKSKISNKFNNIF